MLSMPQMDIILTEDLAMSLRVRKKQQEKDTLRTAVAQTNILHIASRCLVLGTMHFELCIIHYVHFVLSIVLCLLPS